MEVRGDAPRAQDEKLDGTEVFCLGDVRIRFGREFEPVQLHSPFAARAEPGPGGDQDPDLRRPAQDVGQQGCPGRQMFKAVQDKQQFLGP